METVKVNVVVPALGSCTETSSTLIVGNIVILTTLNAVLLSLIPSLTVTSMLRAVPLELPTLSY